MRKLFLTAAVALVAMVFAACSGSGNGNNANASQADSLAMEDNGPRIEFDTAVFDFGRILQGEQVSTQFFFTNAGNADLIISKVETSCGCTVPEYDRQPVRPGERGSIRVRFDSDGKEGSQYKTVKVTTNCAENIFDLVVRGEVEVR